MLGSHVPGKTVSRGPEQVVFCQHDCATTIETLANHSNRVKRDQAMVYIDPPWIEELWLLQRNSAQD